MKFLKFLKRGFFTLIFLVFAALLILNHEICAQSVAQSVVICSRVLIPSLFPFSVCVLFLMKSGVAGKNQGLSVLIFSMLGGYPIGAKLINSAVQNGELSREDGGKMLNFCVNAGPAFIVSAVGGGILNSKSAGTVLLISHILSSLLICLFYRFSGNKITFKEKPYSKHCSFADTFVLSSAESATVTLNICSFVILFSAITGYIEFYSEKFTLLKPLIYLTEVTAATAKTRNIYFISFLLGFAGICIWCQILSVGKQIKITLPIFILFRIIHGALSAGFTAIFVRVFNVYLPTFSNNRSFYGNMSVSGTALSVSLLIMGIIFIISLSQSKKNIKILEEFT